MISLVTSRLHEARNDPAERLGNVLVDLVHFRRQAVGGEAVVRPMMYIALSYDHCLIDGKTSVTFLVRLKELLEDPLRLMLEI